MKSFSESIKAFFDKSNDESNGESTDQVEQTEDILENEVPETSNNEPDLSVEQSQSEESLELPTLAESSENQSSLDAESSFEYQFEEPLQPPTLVTPLAKQDSTDDITPEEIDALQEEDIIEGNKILSWFSGSKRIVAIGAVALIVICVGIAATILLRGNRDIFLQTQQEMRVYFFNSSAGHLNYEELAVNPRDFIQPYGGSLNWVSLALANLQRPPGNLASTWPDTATVINYDLDDRTLVINFLDDYLETPPIQEALFRSALTLTMVSGPFVDEVILVAGDSIWAESAFTIDNSPAISPARLANVQVVLYLIDESGEGLVRTYYTIPDANPREQIRVALERLIEGSPIEGAVSLIPPETRVNVLSDTEIRSVYVNLTGEFSRFTGSPAQANLMIASMVNTVFGNSADLRQVFFLIDSVWENSFHGVSDFNRGFEYDETVMLGFVPEEEEEDEEA